jgi:hypothetical protein
LPAPQAVTVWTGGALAMPWQLQPSASWLDAQPATGSAKQTVSVQPNTTDLPDGGYPATIGVASTAMVAPPRVDVVYEIGTMTGAEAGATVERARVVDVYPNPASRAVVLRFELDRAGAIMLSIHDVYGRCVRSIPGAAGRAGANAMRMDVSDLPRGVYIIVLQTAAWNAFARITVATR